MVVLQLNRVLPLLLQQLRQQQMRAWGVHVVYCMRFSSRRHLAVCVSLDFVVKR